MLRVVIAEGDAATREDAGGGEYLYRRSERANLRGV